MATNKKITELTELEEADLADDDVLPIVDISAGETFKVRKSTLASALSGVATIAATTPVAVDQATGAVTVSLVGTVPLANGGTGATTPTGARNNLGLGTISTQPASNVSITGGTITGITDLAVADGGTGASDAATARTNLGLGTISTQAANSVDIDGGAIDGTTIGGSSAAAGTFTTFTSTGIDDNASSTAITIDSSGNVGIGTAPAGGVQLDVRGTGLLQLVNTDTVQLLASSGGSTLKNVSNNPLLFGTNNTERMRIDSSGNVGIGTSSPATFTNGLAVAGSGSDGDVAVINNTAGAWSFKKVRSDNSNAMGIYDPTGFGAMALYTAGAERMRIDSSGNVGIGTTSVSSATKLEVYENSAAAHVGIRANNAAADGYATLWLSNAGDNTGILRGGASAATYANQLAMLTGSAIPITFSPNNTEAMRITSTGQLLINTTSDALTAELQVHFNGSATQGITIKNTVNSSSGAAVRFVDYTGAYSGGGIYFSSSNTITYATTSDYRLKENVVATTGAVDKVKQLNPVNFNFIGASESVDGFLAHELQAVVPNSVIGEKDAVTTSGENKYQVADYAKLVPLLTAALKEAVEKIETLEARVASLEAN